MREPWDRPQPLRWRLGLKLGQSLYQAEAYIGSAALELPNWKPLDRANSPGVSHFAGADPIDCLIREYRQQSDEECTGVVLYRYKDEPAFADSRACAEGMTFIEHRALIARAADRLHKEGVACEVVTIGDRA